VCLIFVSKRPRIDHFGLLLTLLSVVINGADRDRCAILSARLAALLRSHH
jgi:hypothetical protein